MKARLCCLLTALLLGACDSGSPPPQVVVRPVKLFTVADPAARKLRQLPAQLRASDEVLLSFRRGGHLQSLPVTEGMRVKTGQLLAEVDSEDQRLQLRDREASFNLARAQYQRFSTLSERQMTARAELDQRKAQRDSAEAALNLARQELSYTRLLAPFDGVVARVAVQNHQMLQPAQTVMVMQSAINLDVVFQLPENLAKQLRPDSKSGGYQPLVRLSSLPGREFPATFKEKATLPDPSTLAYWVTYTIPRPADLNLLPGMSANVTIDFAEFINEQAQFLVVPSEAVFTPDTSESDQPQVWVVVEKDGKLTLEGRKVEVGQLTEEGVQVRSGLQPGERIVAVGGTDLQAGQQVRPWVRERGL
ncbi:efflux RND transporter periplasmic adaptor subunit [Metapseudomonas resinovorans]|uniref:Putative RND-type efflux pump membrane fusion protein n=1 Tax=Metapseudomonas resinovorans NBRC 106553 TaxID=1245471 RepID=S6AKA4_METRE|nr:efflux RND transporter periplasmic adaptor subunit [Pseudomonas resinovorans]BAN51302.1 putative RND-type efflux pump membrane fusion protein [Pseudomonas resinovorans NBRC 106553]